MINGKIYGVIQKAKWEILEKGQRQILGEKIVKSLINSPISGLSLNDELTKPIGCTVKWGENLSWIDDFKPDQLFNEMKSLNFSGVSGSKGD